MGERVSGATASRAGGHAGPLFEFWRFVDVLLAA
jgi:hypothetical protein